MILLVSIGLAIIIFYGLLISIVLDIRKDSKRDDLTLVSLHTPEEDYELELLRQEEEYWAERARIDEEMNELWDTYIDELNQ